MDNIYISSLDDILQNIMSTIKNSKDQMIGIMIDAKTETEIIQPKLDNLLTEIGAVNGQKEVLLTRYENARSNLSNVQQHHTVTGKDITDSYEEIIEIQEELILVKEREWSFKLLSKELETKLSHIERTGERAKTLINQMNVVFDYLTNDIMKMNEVMESVKFRQVYGLRFIHSQEEEKKRVAREIHDGPAQTMANVVLRTEIAERLLNQQKFEQAIQELKDLKTMIRKSLADVRQIIFDLRPMVLDDLGLLPTLRKYIPEIAKKAELNIELILTGKEKRISSVMEVAIFRLVQESINNILQYAQATKIQVHVEYSDSGYIKVVIQDNGIGLQREKENANGREHLRLLEIKEVVRLLEGDYEMISAQNKGTIIKFMVPVNESGE